MNTFGTGFERNMVPGVPRDRASRVRYRCPVAVLWCMTSKIGVCL